MLSILGICASSEERERRQRSIQIDRELEQDLEKQRKEIKILLLGSGESGKSTIVKQIKIIHQGGFTDAELESWRPIIYKNLVDSAKDLITSAQKLEQNFRNAKNNEIYTGRILEYKLPGTDELLQYGIPEEIIEAIESIWNDEETADILERGSSQFYIMDSAAYFLGQTRRLTQADYKPTVDDVLRARLKTTGITDTWFPLKGMKVHFFDVGGQRSERKKWIHCFEAVTCIFFCVALSEYDQVLLEESKQNRMVESLVLFESVINSRWFMRTSIVLLLNKTDIFMEKIKRVPLEKYFPEYTGGPDPNKGAKYILWRFNQANRMKLKIYPHLTQAIDTSNIRKVFKVIEERLLNDALQDSGLM